MFSEWQTHSGRRPHRGNVAELNRYLVAQDGQHQADPGGIDMLDMGALVLQAPAQEYYFIPGFEGFYQYLMLFLPVQVGADHLDLLISYHGRLAL